MAFFLPALPYVGTLAMGVASQVLRHATSKYLTSEPKT